jgi:YggT family protein
MGLFLAIVAFVLLLFELLLIARAILDWATTFAGMPRIGSVRHRLWAAVRALTEPVLAPVRRVLPPLRLGGFALDTSFIAVFVAVLILRQIILSI